MGWTDEQSESSLLGWGLESASSKATAGATQNPETGPAVSDYRRPCGLKVPWRSWKNMDFSAEKSRSLFIVVEQFNWLILDIWNYETMDVEWTCKGVSYVRMSSLAGHFGCNEGIKRRWFHQPIFGTLDLPDVEQLSGCHQTWLYDSPMDSPSEHTKAAGFAGISWPCLVIVEGTFL